MNVTKENPAILLVEDEENLQESLKLNLEMEDYEVQVVANGLDALKAIKEAYFDLIILDIMLPGMDGVTVCENIRLQNIDVPILFLSAKNSPEDRITGLKKGGDDYLTKPFELEELLLRVDILIEKNNKIHRKKNIPEQYNFGDNKIDFAAQECVGVAGKTHSLSKRETMLLKLLIENEGKVVPREKILQIVWGYNVYPNTRTIDNFMLNLRKYFEEDTRKPKYFHSIRGVGYKFTV
ncbi:MAG TPA: response regulator transcription factor [Chitinophagaceae bacterium]|nr:response regulator transcription factor [Chitinophagaceae bacterium]